MKKKVFSIQMLLHFSQIVKRVCTLVLLIKTVTQQYAFVACENMWIIKLIITVTSVYVSLKILLIYIYIAIIKIGNY